MVTKDLWITEDQLRDSSEQSDAITIRAGEEKLLSGKAAGAGTWQCDMTGETQGCAHKGKVRAKPPRTALVQAVKVTHHHQVICWLVSPRAALE